jgi:CxxC-x17-CxxC domain-containing protein
MPDYQNRPFKKPFNKGGDRFGGQKRLYKAECSNCHATCEVPFRPNGMKPVFCSNCFKRDDARDQGPRPHGRDFGPRREQAPRPDTRIDDLKRQLTQIEAKLDTLTRLIERPRAIQEAILDAKAPPKKKVVAKKKSVKKK